MTKTLLTLSALALLTSPSLFAAEDSLQEHLQMEQKLQKQYQKRLKDGSGSSEKNKYMGDNNQPKYQYQHRNNMNTTNNATRSMGGNKGGGRH